MANLADLSKAAFDAGCTAMRLKIAKALRSQGHSHLALAVIEMDLPSFYTRADETAAPAEATQIRFRLPRETAIESSTARGEWHPSTWGEFCDANCDDPSELAGVESQLLGVGEGVMGGGAQPFVTVRIALEHGTMG